MRFGLVSGVACRAWMEAATEAAVLESRALDDATKKLLDSMTEWENLGQSVVMGKRAMVELDERRQKCREALKELQKQAKIGGKKKSKNWICFGSTTFLKVATNQAKQMIQDDMRVIDTALEVTRQEVKNQVDKLKKMENCKTLEDFGFSLDPVA
ncbi:unnamed protein product [Litomosoides sigmodontis]|uniref:Uncharacterized protein n=1 Tax=Litomosoides sigmodontis TaxID=42156 RepID=A0A3P6SJ91_LITSI|nr:unnamed protein product [Litomosoides sigmodontis]